MGQAPTRTTLQEAAERLRRNAVLLPKSMRDTFSMLSCVGVIKSMKMKENQIHILVQSYSISGRKEGKFDRSVCPEKISRITTQFRYLLLYYCLEPVLLDRPNYTYPVVEGENYKHKMDSSFSNTKTLQDNSTVCYLTFLCAFLTHFIDRKFIIAHETDTYSMYVLQQPFFIKCLKQIPVRFP